ncbi:hypothetical protein L1987_57967 [Smallanthus sonchifolius]|uniref:Uncharacterized protein n=1 Tax=Smallanthus sonchifolius TaxID=185202 RepID=A0ACB9DEF6_9ASTR|nr:hypothetical protein L1987_57967 [Smallanthus sonchifolius]
MDGLRLQLVKGHEAWGSVAKAEAAFYYLSVGGAEEGMWVLLVEQVTMEASVAGRCVFKECEESGGETEEPLMRKQQLTRSTGGIEQQVENVLANILE